MNLPFAPALPKSFWIKLRDNALLTVRGWQYYLDRTAESADTHQFLSAARAAPEAAKDMARYYEEQIAKYEN